MERRIINGASSDDDDDTDNLEEQTEQLDEALDNNDWTEKPSSSEDGNVLIGGERWIDWDVAGLNCVGRRVKDFDPYCFLRRMHVLGGCANHSHPIHRRNIRGDRIVVTIIMGLTMHYFVSGVIM